MPMTRKKIDDTPILERIQSPADVKRLSPEMLKCLTEELRQRIIQTVDANGGHLGSNLGVVELTLALHLVFDMRYDRLLWDVSHQVYAHKLITGRAGQFSGLRRQGGLSGFSNKRESPFDLYDFGHAGTAVSVAAGLSAADRLSSRDGKTVVVIGDASCGCGISFEGLNHAGGERSNLLVILNDNRMSISNSVGALSLYLQRIRKKPFWRKLVEDIQASLVQIPFVGHRLDAVIDKVQDVVRRSLVPGLIFQELGFQYFGPVDGHDLPGLRDSLERIRDIREPVLLHVHTVKGKGFEPAAANPSKFHGCKNFLPESVDNPKKAADKSYTHVLAETLCGLGAKHPNVCAVTAAMADGTGIRHFQKSYPDRTFDVGIAEEHGACFSSGLSFGGQIVYYVVYSTFAQRAYDQVFHEISLQNNHVVLCLDRAGVVGEDGPTHHGVFDIALFRHLPGVVLAAPRDGRTMKAMLQWAASWPQPVILRYPKSLVPEAIAPETEVPLVPGRAEVIRRGRKVVLFAYGAMVKESLAAADLLLPDHEVTVVDARFAKPIDEALLVALAEDHDTLITVEEHALAGGFGSAVLEAVSRHRINFSQVSCLGVPDHFVTFASRNKLLADLGLDAQGIARAVQGALADETVSRRSFSRRTAFQKSQLLKHRNGGRRADAPSPDKKACWQPDLP